MEPSTILIPIEAAFKFKKFDLEALKDSKDGYLSSTIVRVCKISNVQYYIRIYPNGSHDEDCGMAFAFLVVEIGNAKCVESDLKYSIEAATFSKYVKHVFKTSEAYGKHICSTKQLFYEKNNFFVDDFLVLNVKGIFKILLPFGIKYPLSAKWNIKESELEALKTSTNGCLKSKRFNISSDSDMKYFFTIYPNGNKEENRGAAWIFLHLIFECETSVNAIFSFFIKSANFSVDCQNLYSKSGGWGSFICLTKDLFNLENGYFIDGELCLEISGTLILQKEYSQNTVLKCEKGIETKTCRKYRAKNFTVIVEEKEIEVHEHVLEEASPVFSAMLNSGMKEKLERKMYIPDFTYEIVKAAIQLMYSFSVDQKFTFEQMKQLLRFSDKYDIKLIKDLVQDYLIENLSPTNVCNLIYFTTNIVVASKLRAKCSEYLIKCLKESKAVHGLETLEKDFCHSIFLDAFSQNIVTENV